MKNFCRRPWRATALDAAIKEAIAETGATSAKEMGKVIGALKAKHGAALDMGAASAAVKAALWLG